MLGGAENPSWRIEAKYLVRFHHLCVGRLPHSHALQPPIRLYSAAGKLATLLFVAGARERNLERIEADVKKIWEQANAPTSELRVQSLSD